MVKEFSLSKNERLSGRKAISKLFEEGHSIYVPPLRIIYKAEAKNGFKAVLAVSVPKRLFRKAVDRNLLKRRIREAFRQNKSILYNSLHQSKVNLELLLQYQHKEIQNYSNIEEACIKGLNRLSATLKEED